jgi:hypothetical protein
MFGIDFFSSAKSRMLKMICFEFREKKICNLNNKLREKKGVAKNKHAEALRSGTTNREAWGFLARALFLSKFRY